MGFCWGFHSYLLYHEHIPWEKKKPILLDVSSYGIITPTLNC
jgi:hypothetical protein